MKYNTKRVASSCHYSYLYIQKLTSAAAADVDSDVSSLQFVDISAGKAMSSEAKTGSTTDMHVHHVIHTYMYPIHEPVVHVCDILTHLTSRSCLPLIDPPLLQQPCYMCAKLS